MAEKVILVDDIDGTEGSDVAKRDFDVLGRRFTIDLSDANDKRLRDALETVELFVGKAREVKAAGRGRKAASPAKIKGYTNSDVREWARENGVEVSPKGVIADEVYAAFIEAHPDAAPDRPAPKPDGQADARSGGGSGSETASAGASGTPDGSGGTAAADGGSGDATPSGGV